MEATTSTGACRRHVRGEQTCNVLAINRFIRTRTTSAENASCLLQQAIAYLAKQANKSLAFVSSSSPPSPNFDHANGISRNNQSVRACCHCPCISQLIEMPTLCKGWKLPEPRNIFLIVRGRYDRSLHAVLHPSHCQDSSKCLQETQMRSMVQKEQHASPWQSVWYVNTH